MWQPFCHMLQSERVVVAFAFAVLCLLAPRSNKDDVLLSTVVQWQDCTDDDEMRRQLAAVETSVAQALFALLCRVQREARSAAVASAASEWLCCLLDAHTATFELDPAMRDGVAALARYVDARIKAASKLGELKVYLEVLKYGTLDPPEEAPTDYRVEQVVLQ